MQWRVGEREEVEEVGEDHKSTGHCALGAAPANITAPQNPRQLL